MSSDPATPDHRGPPGHDVRTAAACLVAAAGATLGLATRISLGAWLNDGTSFLLLAPTVLLASVLGGATPGVIAAVLGCAVVIGPDLFDGAPTSVAAVCLFALLSAGLTYVGERMRVTRAQTAQDARRLREREAHLQSILDTVPDAMIITDERGAIQTLSSTAETLFGWSEAEAAGKNIAVLMPAPYREAHDDYMGSYVATGRKRIIGIGRVVAGLKRDGTTFPMHLSIGEVRVGSKRMFTGFVRDLTEREQTETRLQELQAELVHISRLTAMGEMASALAHELNQPLSAIANYLRGCRRLLEKGDPADQPRLAEALVKAADQAVRAGEVIQRLRQFVGRGETERRMENLKALIEEASTLALVGARELGVRVNMTFEEGCELALVDRVQIQQVAINLLRNAVDAMRDSPRRELGVRVAPASGDFIAVEISDTGSGIGEETMPRLFEPFMTTKKEGMGVGLSICRTIVESHGGVIGGRNNPDGGATFTFTLPNATEAAAIA
jgi:two-component system, LuxR family, sensor kinase FixL